MGLFQRKQDDSLTALVIADLQAGSAFAPFPADFMRSTGDVSDLNEGQKDLNRFWAHMVGRLPPKLDYLLLVGDMIEGQQWKERGRYLTEVDPQWQARAAVEMLEPIAKRASEIYVLEGTHYHVGEAGTWEEWVARSLGAEPDAWGHHAYDWLLLDVEGIILDVGHHQSVTIVNTTMPLERELRHSLMIDDVRPDVDLIIRAHSHLYRWLCIDGRLMLACPPMQLQTHYARHSKTPNRYFSRLLGSVLLTLYPGRKTPECTNREDYIKHEALWYNHPPLVAVSKAKGRKKR